MFIDCYLLYQKKYGLKLYLCTYRVQKRNKHMIKKKGTVGMNTAYIQ